MANLIFKNKYLIIGIVGLAILGLSIPYYQTDPQYAMGFFPECPTQKYLKIHCAGCGSQRAIHDLLHLRLGQAMGHNLLLIPSILLIIDFLVRQKSSLLYMRYTPITILIIMVLYTILRNVDRFPFTYLAP